MPRKPKPTEDPRNARKHSQHNREAVGKSLADLGAGRSIVVDKTGRVIGGNATLAEAERLGLPLQYVHTTGDRLVVVVRDDLAPDDPRRKALAIADNRAGDPDIGSTWNKTQLAELLAEIAEALDTPAPAGFTEKDLQRLNAELKGKDTAERIAAEAEYEAPALDPKAVADHVAKMLRAALHENPKKANQAVAVIVPAGRGTARDVLVLVEPDCADAAAELRRLAAAGDPTPLATMFAALTEAAEL